MTFRAAFLFGVSFTLLASGGARADCGPFSNLTFWSDMNHDRMKQYVDVNLNGDWQAQIENLEDRQQKLKEIYTRNSGVELTYKGKMVKLFDEELAAYIEQTETRLQVVKCLAQSQSDAELPEMGTASGPDVTGPVPAQ